MCPEEAKSVLTYTQLLNTASNFIFSDFSASSLQIKIKIISYSLIYTHHVNSLQGILAALEFLDF